VTTVTPAPIRFVVVTLDAHLAGTLRRVRDLLRADLPSLQLTVHVASDWPGDPAAVESCRRDLASADFIVMTQLFQEEQVQAIAEAVRGRRDACDMVVALLCAPELSALTRMGRFSPSSGKDAGPWSPLGLLRRLRGERVDGRTSGERQMAMLKRVPQLLKWVPGPAQDLRAFLLAMQYWLSGSETNIANMVRSFVHRYARGARVAYKGTLTVAPPVEYPESGVYHPSLPDLGIAGDASALPAVGAAGTVGMLVGRSYLLARNTAHYDAAIAACEARGLRVIAAFAAALDSRPAIARFFTDANGTPTVDAVVNLTGFSLVGGPAYNNAEAARQVLEALDVPYLTLQGLEFQSIEGWRGDARGLNPLQATLQVAIPELDGATNPMVVAGKAGGQGSDDASRMIAIPGRMALMADRVARLIRLRRTPRAERRVAITIFNFPPNVGNTGSAAYLDVFASLQHTLAALSEAGYHVELPEGVEALRGRITEGNRAQHGTPANVYARIPVDTHVRREPHLADVERTWGAAPGRQLTDGRSLFVMGERFGNVFIGVQPAFGWEGDPMRLLFEGSFAPTHAFCAYYHWLREDFDADVVLHFGTHGALEFMPGKQVGLGEGCWPERLIGALPNVYLYASNNSSEGTLAKRRGAATLVSYLTPPITNAGLYRELNDVKATVDRWRQADPRDVQTRETLVSLAREQAGAVDVRVADALWLEPERAMLRLREQLAEVERALIPMGLHVVGEVMPADARRETLFAMAQVARPELELPSLLAAIGGEHCAGKARDRAETGVRKVVDEIVRTGSAGWARDALASDGWVRHTIAVEGASPLTISKVIDELARIDGELRRSGEIEGLLRALDARYVPPAPGGDLLRCPAVLPTGRNIYGFDPYRVPSAAAVLEGRLRAELLLRRYREDAGRHPESVAFVLWGSDNMKSDGTPLAQVLALLGAVPRFDSVGRLAGARLVPLAQLGRPRIDAVVSVSGIFRDLLPLQIRLVAEAALLAAQADEPPEDNFVRKHALEQMARTGCDLPTAALRVFGNDEGAYGSNVNLLVDTGTWQQEDELANLFARRKGFAYDVGGRASSRPELLGAVLQHADLSFQNIDSVELGTLDIDQYVESLGGLHRLLEKSRGASAPAYVGDHTGAEGRVRALDEQVAFETRTRTLNPRWYEAQLKAGYEGVRNISSRVTTALGWSATARAVPEWVYRDVARTFVLDPAMRDRLASMNLSATTGMAGRLLEATERGFWAPDAETLAALRAAAEELEDRVEGIHART
jgi:magnesium chelatase subunit H